MRGNGMRCVHREATERVGANRLGRNGMRGRVHREGLDGTRDGTRPGVPQNRGNGLVFDRPWSKQDPVHGEGSGVPQNGGNGLLLDLLRSKRGPVDREGWGVPQNRGNRLVLERYSRTGVLFIGRGVAYRKTGLHGIPFISTVDLLQPPRATVHPPSTSSSLYLRLFIHGLLFIEPPPCATPPATVQLALSMASYSTTPPRAAVFIWPSTVYCSSSPP